MELNMELYNTDLDLTFPFITVSIKNYSSYCFFLFLLP